MKICEKMSFGLFSWIPSLNAWSQRDIEMLFFQEFFAVAMKLFCLIFVLHPFLVILIFKLLFGNLGLVLILKLTFDNLYIGLKSLHRFRLWLLKCCKSRDFYYVLYSYYMKFYFLLYMSYLCYMFYYIFITYLYVYYMFLNLFYISIFTLLNFKFMW